MSDCARLTSSGGSSLAWVGSNVARACSTGRLFIMERVQTEIQETKFEYGELYLEIILLAK
jgi:hypothetical protein